jgi:hypothetical protein
MKPIHLQLVNMKLIQNRFKHNWNLQYTIKNWSPSVLPSFHWMNWVDDDMMVADQAPVPGVENQDPRARSTLVDGANQLNWFFSCRHLGKNQKL